MLTLNGRQPSPLLLLLGLVVVTAPLLAGCGEPNQPPATDYYTDGPTNPGGTGRYYMGREIGTVMSHLDAGRLDRPGRDAEQRTDLLLDFLPVPATGEPLIADIGAGSGFLTTRLARRFPHARIAAVDIQPEMLGMIETRAKAEQLANIDVVLAGERRSGLAAASADVVILVDSYHEFLWPRETLLDIIRALKPSGQIVIVEERAEGNPGGLVSTHRMSAAQLQREMTAVGLTVTARSDELPEQHLFSFAVTATTQPAQ